MHDNLSSNRTLAKNTVLIYIRMLLILLVSLYTSRVILQVLGVSDFGLYSLINGVVLSFTFVNNSLTSTGHRYLAFSIGKNDKNEFNRVFSGSTSLFIVSGVLMTIILIIAGYWLICNRFVIPEERTAAAKSLLLTVGVTFFFSFARISYNSVIIAYERMSFFAYIGIVEAIVKLLIVFMIEIVPFDKLIAYGFLQALATIIFFILYLIYVRNRLQTHYHFLWDKRLIKELSSFSGWSLYDGMASIGKVEFVNFIINGFYGVLVNAAVGVAKQINSAVNSFTSNFQVAFRPQITKSYASGDYKRLLYLINNTSKFSGAIFAMVAVPLCVNVQIVLQLWLGEVPHYSSVFAIFFILSSGLESIGGPLWITAHAIGNIKYFQIITGTLRLLPIPLVYFYLKDGAKVDYVFAALVLSDLLIFGYRIIYLRKKRIIDTTDYLNQTLRLFMVIIIVSVIILFFSKCIGNSIICLIITTSLSIILFALFTYTLLMDKSQRSSLKKIALKYIHKS